MQEKGGQKRGKKKKSTFNCRKRPEANRVKSEKCENIYKGNFSKRLKGCTILVGMFAPQAVGISVQMRRWELAGGNGVNSFIRLRFRCVKQCQTRPRGSVHACVCGSVCM